MRRLNVVPNLTVDEEMFEAAANAVATFAPDVGPLTLERFIAPSSWLLIPNDRGELSKAEMTLLIGVERTVKLNIWHRPDVRGGEKVVPHNHRWETFTGYVALGGYDEDCYWRTNVDEASDRADVDAVLGVTHASPAANVVEHGKFHEIVGVHEPGRTVSLIVCGYGEFGDWCHLDVDSGRRVREQPVAGFEEMLVALNPHRAA